MNTYLFLPLIQTLFCLVLMAIVLKGHFQSHVHRLFSLYLLVLAFWGIIIFAMRASPDIQYAYSWERWLIPLAPFTSVLFYHFSIRYSAPLTQRRLLIFLYTFCIIFIPLAATKLIFSGMQIKPYGFAPIFGPAAIPLWMLFSYTLLIMALAVFIRSYKRSSTPYPYWGYPYTLD
jgi:hypothetical protein